MEKVFISGVSSGLGHGLASEALRRGATVYGLSRREPADLLAQPRFRFASCDLAQADAVPEILGRLLQGVDKLDLAILNSGVLWRIADMAETPLDVLKDMMDVNVWGNKAILDFLFARGLRVDQVVAISSGASVVGARGWNGYSISKAALNMLVKLYAAERPETHFTALAPGLVDTYMQDQVKDLPDDPRFPSIKRLHKARGTPDMPKPEVAAKRLLDLFPRLRDLPSGEFRDVRTM